VDGTPPNKSRLCKGHQKCLNQLSPRNGGLMTSYLPPKTRGKDEGPTLRNTRNNPTPELNWAKKGKYLGSTPISPGRELKLNFSPLEWVGLISKFPRTPSWPLRGIGNKGRELSGPGIGLIPKN